MKNDLMKKLVLLPFFVVYTVVVCAQNGLNFDGVNDVVTTNYVGVSGNNPRTIEAWIKTTANYNSGTGGTQGVLVDWGQMTPNGSRSTFNVSTNNAIRFEVGGSGVSGATAVNDGLWHHVAAVYDPLATPNTSLYVDGVLDVSGNITIPVNTLQIINVKLGERCDGINRFIGTMDEVRIWNVARTATQIQNSMNNQLCSVTDPTLKLYFPFNQGAANGANATIISATDYSPTAANGALSNFALSGTSSNWVTGKTLGQGFVQAGITAYSCGVYTWPLNNQTYTTNGYFKAVVPNLQGCDSIVTLHHLILPKYLITTTQTACESYQWASNGQTYTTSGIYFDSLLSINGCDSVRKLVLTIKQKTYSSSTVSTCDHDYLWSLNGQVYQQSGTYIDTITNAVGCDSIATLNLTLSTLDTTVTNASGMLTASQTNAVYQWINCSDFLPIPNATNQDFVPAANGQYAVIIQHDNCSDTSQCVQYASAGINEQVISSDFTVTPNPSSGEIQLHFNSPFTGTLRLIDLNGKVLDSYNLEAKDNLLIDTHQLSTGIVLLNILNADINSSQRIMIK
jgi:hypothetical protein